VRHPERDVGGDGTASVAPGLLEVTAASRRPAEAAGWLNAAQAARRLGLGSRAVFHVFQTGLVPAYLTATSPRYWCRADDVDRLHTRGVVRDRPNGQGGTRPVLTAVFYLSGDEEDPSPDRPRPDRGELAADLSGRAPSGTVSACHCLLRGGASRVSTHSSNESGVVVSTTRPAC